MAKHTITGCSLCGTQCTGCDVQYNTKRGFVHTIDWQCGCFEREVESNRDEGERTTLRCDEALGGAAELCG
jgi:hypothetical protein